MENRKGLGRGLDSLLGIFDKKNEVVENKHIVSDNKPIDNNKKLDTTEIEISLIDNNMYQIYYDSLKIPFKKLDSIALKSGIVNVTFCSSSNLFLISSKVYDSIAVKSLLLIPSSIKLKDTLS